MNIYGYTKGSDSNERLQELSEITLKADPSELRTIADFILDCANEIENDVNGIWEHMHIEDRVVDWSQDTASIIVFKMYK